VKKEKDGIGDVGRKREKLMRKVFVKGEKEEEKMKSKVFVMSKRDKNKIKRNGKRF
jgi:hypothetical protein